MVDIPYAGRSGEAVMFMEKALYVVMAQALTDATLLHIGKQIFFEGNGRAIPVFCRKIIAGLAQRLHLLMADAELLAAFGPRPRGRLSAARRGA